jgi:two-component system invasion response regulator UvrY
MIKVLIADDHSLVREGLKRILAGTSDIAVTGEAGQGQEILDTVAKNDFDVILLDISMPGRSGVDILKQLRVMNPDLNILMLSMHPEEQYAIRALKAGAAGYLTKDSAPDELITAIRTVSSGRRYVSPTLAETLASYFETETGRPVHETLSDREYEVMCMIASGMINKEIAAELSLSTKTISTYRTRILDKMNMKSSAELIHYVIQNELID